MVLSAVLLYPLIQLVDPLTTSRRRAARSAKTHFGSAHPHGGVVARITWDRPGGCRDGRALHPAGAASHLDREATSFTITRSAPRPSGHLGPGTAYMTWATIG
jgi:hypothetical protein